MAFPGVGEDMGDSSSEWICLGLGPVAWTSFALAVTVVGLIILERWWHMGKLGRLGYTGPPNHFLFGNLKILKEVSADFPDGWKKIIDTYGSQVGNLEGKSMALYQGRVPSVVVTNPEIIKHVGIRDFDNFRNRPFSKFQRSKNLLSLRDDRWKKARHTLTPAFSQAKMKLMSHAINSSITITLEIIDEHVKENKPVDFYTLYHGLTLEVINKCALAMEVDSQRDSKNPLLLNVKEIIRDFRVDSFLRICLCLFPSLMLFLRKSFGLKFSSKNTRSVLDYVQEVIKQRRTSSQGRKTVDALQLMLEAAKLVSSGEDDKIPSTDGSVLNGHSFSESNGQNSENYKSRTIANGSSKSKKNGLSIKKEVQMSEEEVADNAFVFLLAGYETTSTMLSFTSYLLAKHPEVQQRLQEEIDQHIGDTEEVTYDMINQLQYLDMVFNESLRYYPPISSTISREVEKDCEYEGMKFPAESLITFPISYMHYNEEIWPNPKTFEPERFHPDRKKDIHVGTFLPFGLGPRNCIGMRFALLEAKLALARLLRRYTLEPCSLTETDIKIKAANISLTPVSGHIYLSCTPR